jgi:putative ABC transport system permease protein
MGTGIRFLLQKAVCQVISGFGIYIGTNCRYKNLYMFRNYLRYITRSFLRHRQSTIINIAGLSVGLCSALIIALYAIEQYRYDRFHENGERIYRFNTRYGPLNEAVPLGPYLLDQHLTGEIPEILSSIRIRVERGDDFWFRYDDNHFVDQGFFLSDSNFFTFFSFPLLQGNPAEVLNDPNSLVISESAANKIFGANDPLGETIYVQGMYPVTVTGVMADFPSNSHFSASFIGNSAIARNYSNFLFENWGTFGFFYYFLLAENASVPEVARKINDALVQAAPDLAGIVTFNLQNLHDIRLHSQRIAWDIDTQGNITLLKGLIAVAIIIMLLASVNYINMYTVQATSRKKEIGVRKVMGAGQAHIFLYSIMESAVYILVSFVLALCMAEILMPYIAVLTGNALSPAVLFAWPNWIWLFVVLLSLSLLSGFYPAYIVGRFRPSDILRSRGGSVSISASFPERVLKIRFGIRQVLTIFQFACAIALIILSFSVNRQIRFMLEVDHGYRDQGLFVIFNPKGDGQESRFFSLKNSLESWPEIEVVTTGMNVPSERLNNFTHIRIEGDEDEVQSGHIVVHEDYLSAIGSTLLAGRVFEPGYGGDYTTSVVINRTAARVLGMSPEEIIGVQLTAPIFTSGVEIIGVVEDIHFFSLHDLVSPMVFTCNADWNSYEKILVSSGEGGLMKAVETTRKVWEEEHGEYPLNFAVLEDRRRQQYSREIHTQKLTGIFTGLAIIISLMGLYALASFVLNSRAREIALRKVLGANPLVILKMIVREFSFLVLAGALLAWPVVWLAYNRWLENFAYRQDINYLIFIAAPLIAMTAAWITISYHTLRAATANPARALKHE